MLDPELLDEDALPLLPEDDEPLLPDDVELPPDPDEPELAEPVEPDAEVELPELPPVLVAGSPPEQPVARTAAMRTTLRNDIRAPDASPET